MIAVTIALGVCTLTLGLTTAVAVQRIRRLDSKLQNARQFIELANDPVLVADIVEGRIIHANSAVSELLGYDVDELLQRKLPSLHPKELVSRSADIIADVWEKKGLIYSDLPFAAKDGTHIPIEASARVFEFEGEPAIVIFARDIRERLRLEAQLVQSEKMASLGQLVAGVAHEINTPIGAINANVAVTAKALEMLKDVFENEAFAEALKGERRLRRVVKILDSTVKTSQLASDRIIAIVASLTNFARLDEAERKKVDIHDGIESTLTLLQHELKYGVDVVRNYGDLPLVECYANQLNQVFMNLLVNGVHAMEGKGTATIATSVEGDEVVIRFSDTGRGILPEHVSRIFDPGFTTKGVGVGTGLGLSITFQIIEKHGGSIEVDTEVGSGSTFEVRLPK